MKYRWLDPYEIENLMNPALKRQGMAQLNINIEQPTCRVLGAFWDGQLVEAFAFQFVPMLGPMIKVDGSFRDDGSTSRILASKMAEFFEDAKARTALCIAGSPVTERLCERFEMEKVDHPVFQFVRR